MTILVRNQAICICYNGKYTKENAVELIKKGDVIDVDMCYLDDPEEPYLVWQTRISRIPFVIAHVMKKL